MCPPLLPPGRQAAAALEEKAIGGRLPTCEITTIDLLENAFPLCLHALLSRYSSITGGRRPGSLCGKSRGQLFQQH